MGTYFSHLSISISICCYRLFFQVYIETYRIRFLKAEKSPQKDMDGFVNRVGKVTSDEKH